MKTLPWSFDDRGTLPLGYFALNAPGDRMVALPLIEVKGLMSQEGVR